MSARRGFAHAGVRARRLKELREKCRALGVNWIPDADIQGYFDSIDRKHLQEFIRRKVNDGTILRFIGKWLNAGVWEEGQVTCPETGTPQGGVISPLLSNIFLHYVLDEWFEQEVKPRLKGRAFLMRFADDFVIGFEHEKDARRVMEVLPKRFERYGLTIHPEKTKSVEFSSPGRASARRNREWHIHISWIYSLLGPITPRVLGD